MQKNFERGITAPSPDSLPTRRKVVTSAVVSRHVGRDERHGLIVGDVTGGAREISFLQRAISSAFDESHFDFPADCSVQVILAESVDASDFRVVIFLSSSVLDDNSLGFEAARLGGQVRQVFEGLSSPGKDRSTIDLYRSLNSAQVALTNSLTRLTRSVSFTLVDQGMSAGPLAVTLKKAAVTEKNTVSGIREVAGRITCFPERSKFVLEADGDKIIVAVAAESDRIQLTFFFACSLSVELRVAEIESSSKEKPKQAFFQLEKVLKVCPPAAADLDGLLQHIHALEGLLSLDAKLRSPNSAKSRSAKRKFGQGRTL